MSTNSTGRNSPFTSPSTLANSMSETVPVSLLTSAQSFVSIFWYLFPVAVILALGICQGICVRVSAWSDRRRMRAFTKRSCLQKMRSRLCRGCDGHATETHGKIAGTAAQPSPALAAAQPEGESVTSVVAAAPLPQFAPMSTSGTANKNEPNASSFSPARSMPTHLASSRPTALQLGLSAHESTSAAEKLGSSPIESPLSLNSDAPSLTTSSFEENLTPRCVPNYSLTQKRSIEEQRRATVDDWVQAKRAMGELSRSE